MEQQSVDILERMIARRHKDVEGEGEIEHLHEADVRHGVTVGWLATVFRMDPTTVKKKLVNCPPIARKKAGHVYDLKVAAQFLVTPVFDIAEHLKTMNPRDLPVTLQEAYWSGMRKKQDWEEKAAHLWPTERVLEVLGEVFQHIKFAIQLWPDQVERALGLTSEQRKTMIGMGDALQREIHDRLVSMPAAKRTPSSLDNGHAVPVEIDDMPVIQIDDYSHLI
jgi:hypothetical protein